MMPFGVKVIRSLKVVLVYEDFKNIFYLFIRKGQIIMFMFIFRNYGQQDGYKILYARHMLSLKDDRQLGEQAAQNILRTPNFLFRPET